MNIDIRNAPDYIEEAILKIKEEKKLATNVQCAYFMIKNYDEKVKEIEFLKNKLKKEEERNYQLVNKLNSFKNWFSQMKDFLT